MGRKERLEPMLTRVAELFDLPGDLVAGLCHMEMLGDRQLFLEGHQGIVSCLPERIDISTGSMTVCVCGEGLEIRSMTEQEVCIRGTIRSVELLHG